MGQRCWAIAVAVSLIVSVQWVSAIGSIPCSLHGRWQLLSSEYRDSKLQTPCDLREKTWTVGPGTVLVSAHACPTEEQAGRPANPNLFLHSTYRFLDVREAPSRVPHGVADEGCSCVFLSTSDDADFNSQLSQAKAIFGNEFATLCMKYQRRDNTLVAKSDLFRISTGFKLHPARCPNSTDWQASDVGFTRYRDVMIAQGPLHRDSNQSIVYGGISQAEVNALTGLPLSSLALAPACMPFDEPDVNTTAPPGSNGADDCVEVHQELQYAALGAAIVSLLLITSWFGCCVWVWHAKQQPASPKASQARTTVAMVLVSMFLHIFSVALILPALTPLVVDNIFEGSTSEASVFLTTVHVIASALEFCSNPVVGGVSDERGRKTFLIGSLSATVVSFFIIGALPSRATIAISGAMRGLTAVTVTMGNAMIVDVSKLGQHGRDGENDVTVNLGFLLAVAALGLMCGPIIGGIIGLFSLQAPFILAAGIEVLNAVFVYGFVPETLQVPAPFSWSAANPVALVRLLCSTPALRLGTVVLVLVNLGFGVYSQAALWTQLRFEWGAMELGGFLTFIGLLSAITIGVVSKYCIPAWGDARVVLVGVVCGVFQMVLLGFSTHAWMWFIVLLFTSFAFVTPTALRGVITKQAPREIQGKIQGCVGSLNTATGAVGPVIGSVLFVWGTDGSENLRYSVDPGAALCFLAAAGLFALAAVFAHYLRSTSADEPTRGEDDQSRFVALVDVTSASPTAGARADPLASPGSRTALAVQKPGASEDGGHFAIGGSEDGSDEDDDDVGPTTSLREDGSTGAGGAGAGAGATGGGGGAGIAMVPLEPAAALGPAAAAGASPTTPAKVGVTVSPRAVVPVGVASDA